MPIAHQRGPTEEKQHSKSALVPVVPTLERFRLLDISTAHFAAALVTHLIAAADRRGRSSTTREEAEAAYVSTEQNPTAPQISSFNRLA